MFPVLLRGFHFHHILEQREVYIVQSELLEASNTRCLHIWPQKVRNTHQIKLGILMASLSHFALQDIFKLRDVTEDAKEVVKCVRELTPSPRDNYTLLHFVEIFRGEGTDSGFFFVCGRGRGGRRVADPIKGLVFKGEVCWLSDFLGYSQSSGFRFLSESNKKLCWDAFCMWYFTFQDLNFDPVPPVGKYSYKVNKKTKTKRREKLCVCV